MSRCNGTFNYSQHKMIEKAIPEGSEQMQRGSTVDPVSHAVAAHSPPPVVRVAPCPPSPYPHPVVERGNSHCSLVRPWRAPAPTGTDYPEIPYSNAKYDNHRSWPQIHPKYSPQMPCHPSHAHSNIACRRLIDRR